MTFKHFSRAGLLALAGALVLAILLCLPTFHAAFAEAAAEAPAAAAAAPPACDAKILTDCSPSAGDTAWMLVSVALVLMMTIPGLALFYAGMVRKKNILATLMQSFAITCIVTIAWFVCGYSLAFHGDGAWFGDFSAFLLQ